MSPDRETVLFAHANGFTATVYEKFLKATGFNRCFSIERLGHGECGVGRNWTGITAELQAFAASLPGPVVGIGHSLGAFALYRAALLRPDLYKALVLMEPPMLRPSLRAKIQAIRMLGLLDRYPPVSLAKKRRRSWPDFEAARDYLMKRPFFSGLDPVVFEAYLQHGIERSVSGEWVLRFHAEVEYEIFRQGPPPLEDNPGKVPLLFLYGSQTDVLTRADLAHVRKRLSNSSAVVEAFPGGHLFPLEQPVRAGKRVGEWLRSLP